MIELKELLNDTEKLEKEKIKEVVKNTKKIVTNNNYWASLGNMFSQEVQQEQMAAILWQSQIYQERRQGQ